MPVLENQSVAWNPLLRSPLGLKDQITLPITDSQTAFDYNSVDSLEKKALVITSHRRYTAEEKAAILATIARAQERCPVQSIDAILGDLGLPKATYHRWQITPTSNSSPITSSSRNARLFPPLQLRYGAFVSSPTRIAVWATSDLPTV